MSRIWSALPQLGPLDQPPIPHDACWWRLTLRRSDDHPQLVVRYNNADPEKSRLVSWEFVDGDDKQLVMPIDVSRVQVSQRGTAVYLDVVCSGGPPTTGPW